MSTPVTASRWTDDLLDPLREAGDPLADNAVGQLFADGSVPAVNGLMQMLVANDGVVPEGLPAGIRDYLGKSGQLPGWADSEKIRAGERLFWRYGPEMVANLLMYSLPFCYAGRNGVQALSLTTRLYSNPTRRVIETAQMVIDVMQPGGLAAGGQGLRTAQKVRLMHAGIRYQIKAYPAWNPAWGLPVNQEDLAGTLMAFSWIVLDGLRRLGFPVSGDEADAYVHCWNVVGHVLGVRPELLPANDADAGALAHKISQRQFGASPEGQDLTRALIQMMQHYIPGNLLDSVPPTMTRWFLGDTCADYLGVARSNAAAVLLEPLRFVNHLVVTEFKTVEPLGRVHEIFSRRLIESFLWVERGGKRIPFTIPTELRQAWGINWTA